MKFSEYVAYFEQAAKSNKLLAHGVGDNVAFKRIDIEDVLNGIKQDMVNTCMFLENPEIRTADILSDNPRKLFNGAFLIMKNTDKGDFEQQISALDECMTISEQVLTKIVNDSRISRQNPSHPWQIKGFDVNTIGLEKVGPVFGNWFGWRVQFTINQTFTNRLVLKASDWYDDVPFSIL